MRIDMGYLPADVKHHRTIQPAKRASKLVSSLGNPTWWGEPGCTATSYHFEDSLQLAHYTRMLQACGFHSGKDRLFGAILGTSLLAQPDKDPEVVFVGMTLPARRAPPSPAAEARCCVRCWSATTTNTSSGRS